MVDYTKIADGDPGGELADAFNAMRVETEPSNSVAFHTYVSIGGAIGFNTALQLSARVTSLLPSWVDEALQSEGLDVNDAQIPVLLDSLVDVNFTQGMADAVKGAGTQLKYIGLAVGHLANARTMRADGEI